MAQILLNLHGSGIILTAAIMLISGFLFTRLTKLAHLPNVTGYILSGVLIGPWCLHLVPQEYISQMDFITDVALAFIAFGVGKYFKLSALKKSGIKVVILTLFESLTAGVLITIVMLLLGLSLPFSLLLGAIGCATAPASTIMTIRQYKAKGHFIDTILQVVALDDAVALIAFSVCAAIVQATAGEGGLNMTQLLLPIFFNIVALLIGGGSGWLLSKLIHERRSKDHSLVLACVCIMGVAGFCSTMNVSPLLACMASGTIYINTSGNKHLFKQLNQFTPPLLVMFFVLSGMRLSLPSLISAGFVGVIYFLVRIVGKYLGSTLGALVTNATPEIKKYFGLALIPQAGVSIGLAVLGRQRRDALHDHPVQRNPLRDGRPGLRQSSHPPLRQHPRQEGRDQTRRQSCQTRAARRRPPESRLPGSGVRSSFGAGGRPSLITSSKELLLRPMNRSSSSFFLSKKHYEMRNSTYAGIKVAAY